MAVKNSKILKVAGLSLVGFCAVSIGVDKANIGPVASQLAGFCGAFLGGWVAARRRHHDREHSTADESAKLDPPADS
ncbi:MAG TPA: hypothetical protein VKX25_19140 [Bryobacteraceae bacterium]|jgi:uncharacterized membrane protein YeaQ/YmgE (transglycosylase-associated protein family)|nr:hypothetical protein [Bryobacteraceae bacterium]